MSMTPQDFAQDVSQQFFQPPFNEAADDRFWQSGDIYTMKDSKSLTEQTFGFTDLGPAVEGGIWGKVHYAGFNTTNTVTWTHATFTLGCQVPLRLIEVGKYINYTKEIGKSCGRGHAYKRDYAAALPFINAFDSNYPHALDAVELCGTRTRSGISVVNVVTGASLDYTSLWDFLNYFAYGMVTETGLPMTDVAAGILFHPSKRLNAWKAVQNTVEPDTGNRNDNFIKSKFNLTLTECMFLDEGAWFVWARGFKDDNWGFEPVKPVVDQEPEFDHYGIKMRSRSIHSWGSRSPIRIIGTAG